MSSMKGKEVDLGKDDRFVFMGGFEENIASNCGTKVACGGMEKIVAAGLIEGFVGLENAVGLQSLDHPVGLGLGSGVIREVSTFVNIGSGSESGVIMFSDEGIGPTGQVVIKPGNGKINRPRTGKWKKAARMGQLLISKLLSGEINGKRQVCTSVDVFSCDHKKPRTDASLDNSDGFLSADRLSPTCRT